MKYFEILSDEASSTRFPVVYVKESSPWANEFLYLTRPVGKDHTLPIEYVSDRDYRMDDLPHSLSSFLVSGSMIDVVKRLTKRIEIFPSVIYNKKNEIIGNDYYTVVHTESFPAIHWRKSDCKRRKDTASFVMELVLSKKKVKKIPDTEDIFRIKECEGYLVATENARDLIVGAQLKDVYFKEIPVL